MFSIDDIENISFNKTNEFFKEEGKKDTKVLNKKRERTYDKTIDTPKIEFQFCNINIEIDDSKNINDEFIYIGCEDGNIKLVKINNESIFKVFFK